MSKLVTLLQMLRYRHLTVLFSYVLAALALSLPAVESSDVAHAVFGSVFIFFAVFGYNYITDAKEDLENRKPTPMRFINANTMLFLLALLGGASLYVSYLAGPSTFLCGAVILALGLAYSHPRIRFKKRFLLKTTVVSACCFLMFLYLCFALGSQRYHEVLVLGTYLGLTSFAGSVLRDATDVKGDKKFGIQTIPAVLGEQKTNLIVFATIAVKYAALFIVLTLSLVSLHYLLLLAVLPLRLEMLRWLHKKNYASASRFSLASYPATGLTVLGARLV